MSTCRARNAFLAITIVLASAGATATSVLVGSPPPAAAAGSDTGTSNAYGASVTLGGSTLLAPTPSVTLGVDGSGSSLSDPSLNVLGVLSSGTLDTSASSTNFSDANETISAASTVQNVAAVNLGLGSLLSVGAVDASCTSSASGSVGATTVASLKIGGSTVSLPSTIPANFGLNASQLGVLSGLVSITVNAQSAQDRPSFSGTSLDVVGLRVTVLTGLDSGAVIDVAGASCQATGTDIEAVPTVSGLSPQVGPAAGGTTVTIDGTGFVPTSAVDFGGIAATNVHVVSATVLTATSPADSAITTNTAVPVTVANTWGTGPASNGPSNDFTYEVAPGLTGPGNAGLDPTSGPTSGGTVVTITGTDFGTDSTVAFGTNPGTNVVVGAGGTSLTVDAPASTTGAGNVNVTVSDAGGTSNAESFDYVAPGSVTVTALSSHYGSTGGSGVNPITITGTGFTVSSVVDFGTANPSSDVTFVSSTSLTATAPSHAAGTVDVTVTASSQTSPAVVADEYTYETTPAIVPSGTGGLSPAFGATSGGTSVTITGTGFGPDATVAFGTNAGTGVVVAPDGTSLTVDSPPSTTGAGAVNVSVHDGGGTSNAEPFDYIAAPTINSSGGLVPAQGPTAGGTTVEIFGTNFTNLGTTIVTFAGNEASDVTYVNASEITAVDPAGVSGAANVVVSDVGGQSGPQSFTYVAPPVIGTTGLSPAFGPDHGGSVVTLSGSGLTGISAVAFGGTCTSGGASGGTAGSAVTAISDGSARVTTPVHADGPALVCVTAAGGTAEAAEPFTFESAPVVGPNGLNPTQGPVPGGTTVTITGSGFAPGDPATAVAFGGRPATGVKVVSTTKITAVTPASPLASPGTGAVSVTVADAGGGPATAAQHYTYVIAPSLTGISPTSGPHSGGEPVTIKGTNLCGVTHVFFGSTPATVTSVSADCTTLTVDEPAGSGTVPVVVTTPGGSALSPVQFTYIQPGYWEAASDGGVFSFGGAKFYGSVPGALRPGQSLNEPIVAMADTPDHGGYWLFAADGGVFCFGDATFYGSVPGVLAPGQKLNGPVVSAEATPDGHGYRMFAADGGVFDFGDAVYEGSLPGLHVTPNAPVEGAISYPFGEGSNPDAAGYWLIGADGAVYGFGNAPYLGGPHGLTSPVVSLATTPTGQGYYVFSKNGYVNAYGDAISGMGWPSSLNEPIIFGQATSTGKGYWEFAGDGGVFTYGDAPFEGSLGSLKLNAPITAGIAFGSN